MRGREWLRDDDENEEERREDGKREFACSIPIRVDVEADRRSQHRIYNQHDCLTPHNQRPYPYYVGNIVASPVRFTPFRPRVSLFPGAQAGTSLLRSFHVDITWEIRSSPLFSRLSFLSHHLFGYLLVWVRCHCARGLITPIMTRNET